MSFVGRLAAAWRTAIGRPLVLAAVPLVSALLQFDKIERVLEFRGLHHGINVRFPTGLTGLWTLVSLPNQESGITVAAPLVLLPVLAVVRAALVAGYLGAVHSTLVSGRVAFAAGVRRYFRPFLGYSVLTFGLGLVTLTAALAGGPAGAGLVLLVGLPAYLLLSYLFYAAPYLVVVRGDGLVAALVESYRLAVRGGGYLRFGLGYLLVIAGLSLVVTAVVVNLGVSGLLVGLVVGSVAGLTLDVATMRFVMDLVEELGEP